MTHEPQPQPRQQPQLVVAAYAWPEVRAGDDLAQLLVDHAGTGGTDDQLGLSDGDVVVVTSKVVSKAEGRQIQGDRRDAVEQETVRVLARRGDSVIAQTRHGLVMAAAGVDASNTEPGTALLLPLDPDTSARRLRDGVLARIGRNVAVVVSDTAGRAWRNGQVDIAIGCAGIAGLTDLSGTTDPFGNVLVVTAPATADEIASAADLVKGKTSGRPVAVVRGLSHLVLPPGDHGLGAAELVRPSDQDMFGLGTREAAVSAAVRSDPVALAHFPPRFPVDPPPFGDLASVEPHVRVGVAATSEPSGWLVSIDVHVEADVAAWAYAGRVWERCAVLAAAHRLVLAEESTHRHTAGGAHDGWRGLVSAHWVVA